jgi:hypothetical protein
MASLLLMALDYSSGPYADLPRIRVIAQGVSAIYLIT